MRKLFINEIYSKLSGYKPYGELVSRLKNRNFPICLHGIQDGLYPFIIKKIHETSGFPTLIITPSTKEAENIRNDLSGLLGEEAQFFPWWGVSPYKDVSPLNSVFQDRVKILTDLCLGKKTIVIAPLARSFERSPRPITCARTSSRSRKGARST
jgi:transcription-repair coupling factor (superfamily II helicase)